MATARSTMGNGSREQKNRSWERKSGTWYQKNESWDWDCDSTTSATDTTSDARPTPTHSTTSEETVTGEDEPYMKTHGRIEHHPQAGKSFIISSRDNPKKVIALVNGVLQIYDGLQSGGGYLWHCVQKDGWYGFRNTASGTYIGHNNKGQLIAKASCHLAYEHFMANRHQDGGYLLLTRHVYVFGGDNLWQIAIGEDGKTLVETKEGGTPWEFNVIEPPP